MIDYIEISIREEPSLSGELKRIVDKNIENTAKRLAGDLEAKLFLDLAESQDASQP